MDSSTHASEVTTAEAQQPQESAQTLNLYRNLSVVVPIVLGAAVAACWIVWMLSKSFSRGGDSMTERNQEEIVKPVGCCERMSCCNETGELFREGEYGADLYTDAGQLLLANLDFCPFCRKRFEFE